MPLDRGGLTTKIALVFELDFDTGDVECGGDRIDFERNRAGLQQVREADLWALQRARRRDTRPVRHLEDRGLNRGAVALVPIAPTLKPLPTPVVHEPNLSAER